MVRGISIKSHLLKSSTQLPENVWFVHFYLEFLNFGFVESEKYSTFLLPLNLHFNECKKKQKPWTDPNLSNLIRRCVVRTTLMFSSHRRLVTVHEILVCFSLLFFPSGWLQLSWLEVLWRTPSCRRTPAVLGRRDISCFIDLRNVW